MASFQPSDLQSGSSGQKRKRKASIGDKLAVCKLIAAGISYTVISERYKCLIWLRHQPEASYNTLVLSTLKELSAKKRFS